MAITTRWLLAAVGAAFALGAGSADYSGKYAKDPRMQKLLRELPAAKKKALDDVRTKLQLAPKQADRIRVVVEDAIEAEPGLLAPFRGTAFTTETDEDASDTPVVVRLRAEFLMNGCHDLATALRHEMVHAVMRERMDGPAYRTLPKWLREGIAVWAAGQGETKLLVALTDPGALEKPDAAFPGVDEGDHGVDRYAEYFLALDFLEQQSQVSVGGGAVVRLVALLVKGIAVDLAVEQASGLSFDEFKKKAHAHALEVASTREPEGRGDFKAVVGFDKARKYAEAKAAAVEFEQQHPRSPFLADALYLRGKAERLSDDPKAAIATLERLVSGMLAQTHFFDEAWYQLGSARLALDQLAPAGEAFQTVLRDHPDTSLQDKAALRLAQVLGRQGQKKAALAWLDRFDRSFPKSASAGEARKLRDQIDAK
jgi:TolA-binding protein